MSFGGGSGGGQTSTIQKADPYAPAQPALNQIISEAGQIYGQGPSAAGYVQPTQQTLQGLAGQETVARSSTTSIRYYPRSVYESFFISFDSTSCNGCVL